MPQNPIPTLKTAGALLALALALLALSACGSSSKSSSTASTSAAATGATGPTQPGALAGRFGALRECLHRNGITLPPRKPGVVGGLLGRQLPHGVTAAQLEAAMKKCGFAGRHLPFPGLRGRSRRSPQLKAALARFATCMREHGVALPAPNTTGPGPIFNTAGVNIHSAHFLTAQAACRRTLAGG